MERKTGTRKRDRMRTRKEEEKRRSSTIKAAVLALRKCLRRVCEV